MPAYAYANAGTRLNELADMNVQGYEIALGSQARGACIIKSFHPRMCIIAPLS